MEINFPERIYFYFIITKYFGYYAISKFNEAVAIVNNDFLYTEWTDNSGHPYERMLFDHSTDPLEMDNLAEKEKYQKTVEELSSALHSNWGDDYLNLK